MGPGRAVECRAGRPPSPSKGAAEPVDEQDAKTVDEDDEQAAAAEEEAELAQGQGVVR